MAYKNRRRQVLAISVVVAILGAVFFEILFLDDWIGGVLLWSSDEAYLFLRGPAWVFAAEPDRGVLTCTQMNEVATAVGSETNLILKMNDKESLQRSLAWLGSCFTEGGHSR